MEDTLLDNVSVNSFTVDGETITASENKEKTEELKQKLSEEDIKKLQEEFKKEADRLQDKFKLAPPEIAETIELEDVTPEEAKAIIDDKEDLFAFCELMDGMGLSASQLGINKKYFVARDMAVEGGPFKIYFNPKYFPNGSSRSSFKEGCLTYPGQTVVVKRWKGITFHWYGFDEKGEWKKFHKNIGGLNAIIIAHEIDHCAGYPGSDGKIPRTIMTIKHH